MKNLLSIDPIDTLRWHAEMGVDLCIEPTPQRLQAEASNPKNTSLQQVSPSPGADSGSMPPPKQDRMPLASSKNQPVALPSIAAAMAEAKALADAATDLAGLENAVRGFNGCSLKKTATNTVFAQGVPESRVMFIGEAPGAEEDRNGVPFCGPSGKLLDLMLGYIGLTRSENFYITNTLFWRPPGNRQPTPEELAICRPFVEKHIALVNPKRMVLVGGTATKSVLGDSRGITKIRGQVFHYTNQYLKQDVPVHVIYHPSYLLRQPLAKKQCWADLLALKAALTEPAN